MLHIRTTKTKSKATAVQVITYKNRKMYILVHIGSAHDQETLRALKTEADNWIERNQRLLPLFSKKEEASSNLIPLDKCKYLGVRYNFIYEVLYQIFQRFGFHVFDKIVVDLALIRIIEPASKLRSIELLRELFGIRHSRKTFYQKTPQLITLKDKAETKILNLAKKEFSFDFSLVFYDVTTLYFETFKSDELRKAGFSKDNKPQQPQILIGLIVTSEGLPVAYDVFEGNTFEGHTFIPVIQEFKKKHNVKKLTVVADAAMISFNNITELKKHKLHYIVGARMGNLPSDTISEISSRLNQKDGKSIRIKSSYGNLICAFSSKRYHKDKSEMKKQIEKAKNLIGQSSKTKRVKFLKNKGKSKNELNQELIQKTEKLLGIKGYYTNLNPEISNQTIINHYHNLWHIEQAFRVAKSDLQVRPIYHFKKDPIYVHILICFMALAVCKYMEIKTGKSVKQIVKLLKDVTDARIRNDLSGKEFRMRSEVSDKAKEILEDLNLSY